MNRWIARALPGLVLACICLVHTAATAQQGFVREAPTDVKPAIIGVSATPPIITVNGQPDRMSPGVRIRDRNNMLVLTGSLAGTSLYTVYKRDPAGLVHEVWLLSAEEYARVGGINVGEPDGFRRFNELLALIFGARAAGVGR